MSNFSPHIKGPTRFAVILLCFNDLPQLSIPNSVFEDFVAGVGTGSVLDYWKDISFGSIDLTGSKVYGPYTMQYSYVRNGNQGRSAWISEAYRLAKENKIDLSPFYGVIAVVNSNPDDPNAGKDLALGISEWGQNNWRWCNKCEGSVYAGNPSPGSCYAGGMHNTSRSADYTLALDMPDFPGQNNWRWCNKCQGLSYAGNPTPGTCPAGGFHDHAGSEDYSLILGLKGFAGQDNWKWCQKCQGLAYAGLSSGSCPNGGTHDHSWSANYTLIMGKTKFPGQNQWRWCQKCQGLAYSGHPPGRCPDGGNHDYSLSADYTLLHFGTAESFLLGSWQTGGMWINFEKGLSVLVNKIDTASATATIDVSTGA